MGLGGEGALGETGLGARIRVGRGHQLARIPLGILAGKLTDFSAHLRFVLGMFTQAFLQTLTPVGEQWSERY